MTIDLHYQGTPKIMGVLNITPDSFSDGGAYLTLDEACRRAEVMLAEGADIIDIGAESTRPHAKKTPEEEELKRILPVIEALHSRFDVTLSVDTYKPRVMQAAVEMGAHIINDVYALRQPQALETAAALDVPVCLLFMQGELPNMVRNLSQGQDIYTEAKAFFDARIKACMDAGIARDRLILDIGFGFGKTVEENVSLIRNLHVFTDYKLPLLIGVSRKSTIGAVLNQDVDKRLSGGLALSVFSALQGASMVRTHDVAETKQALMMLDSVMQIRGKDD